MRFRTGLIVGLAVGYYYGAKAGRDRYHQIDQYLDKVRRTAGYQDLRIKVNDGFREGTTAARRLIEDTAFGGDADAGPEPLFVDDDPTSPDLRAIFTDPTLN
jgi:hypothetical protein